MAILSHSAPKTAPIATTARTHTCPQQYGDSDKTGSHAIVMGGSISGLLAAQVLINHFERVTLLERDQFPDTPEARPGVPQGAHVHALLMHGQKTLDQLFPGLMNDLKQLGAIPLDWLHHWKFLSIWGWLEQHESGLEGVCCSRLLIEWCLRQRLLRHNNFCLRSRCYVKGLRIDSGANPRVTGVEFQEHSDLESQPLQYLEAALVVDATGRQSKLPQYLSKLGFEPPSETIVNSFLGYASRWYKRPPDQGEPLTEQGLILVAQPEQSPRGGVLYPVEGNRWVVTLTGISGNYPPGDEAGFMDFMKRLRDPILYERVKDAEPCSPIYCYRRTENQWRHYERLQLPAGLVALGDSVCCFNPVYGQGMTAAASGAMILDQMLRRFFQGSMLNRGEVPVLDQCFTSQFHKRLAMMLKTPWLMATGEDFRWEKTVGDRPGWLTQQLQGYFDRVLQLARVDPVAHRAFIEVAHLTKPPTALFSPSLIWKMLTQRLS